MSPKSLKSSYRTEPGQHERVNPGHPVALAENRHLNLAKKRVHVPAVRRKRHITDRPAHRVSRRNALLVIVLQKFVPKGDLNIAAGDLTQRAIDDEARVEQAIHALPGNFAVGDVANNVEIGGCGGIIKFDRLLRFAALPAAFKTLWLSPTM